jgi:hypothetical protein
LGILYLTRAPRNNSRKWLSRKGKIS